jgi:hypothetical protein
VPEFYAQTYKTHPFGKWTNVYQFGAATLDEAVSDMLPILETLELPMLHQAVTLKAVRFSTVTPGDSVFAIIPLNAGGTSSDSGDLLPFFNCARVDISIIGGGRPSRKYWKGLLTESLVTAMQVNGGTATALEGAFNSAIADANDAGHAFHDNDGQDWDVATVQSLVQMRQMHRRRRKTPVVTP